jgi:hypothetical protein
MNRGPFSLTRHKSSDFSCAVSSCKAATWPAPKNVTLAGDFLDPKQLVPLRLRQPAARCKEDAIGGMGHSETTTTGNYLVQPIYMSRHRFIVLNVIYRNVLVDRAVPVRGDEVVPNQGDFPVRIGDEGVPNREDLEKWSKEKECRQLEQKVRDHVQELLKWSDEHPVVRDAATAIDNSKLKAMLDDALTDDQLKDAKDRFDKALELFLDKGAEITIHPLSEMLSLAGLPHLTTSIVKDLYGARLTRLSKAIVDPLADALFRPRSYEASLAPVALARAWERPVFDEKVLPPRIATPTVGDRLAERANRMIVEKVVRETAREAR